MSPPSFQTKMLIVCASFTSMATTSMQTFAHAKQFTHIEHRLVAGGSLTLRSDDMTESNEAYLIPGTLMGGEAVAYEKGLSLDDAHIRGAFAWSDYLMLEGEISSHQHGDDQEVEVETFSLVYRPLLDHDFYIAVGKMNSRIAPSASWHSNAQSYADAWLQSDIHFGRHGSDNGLRISYEPGTWQLGLEAWNGDQWPASDREGSISAYAIKDTHFETISLRTGAWISRAKAERRRDERYGEGHSHSGDDVETPSSEFSFDGDIDGYGAYISSETEISDELSVLFDLEYVNQEHEGSIQRESQEADLSYSPETYRINTGFRFGEHTLKAQWERLIVTNHFRNDVDSVFMAESNLDNSDHEPTRTTIAWHWQVHPDVVSKLEWVNEELIDPDESRSRVNLSINLALDILDRL